MIVNSYFNSHYTIQHKNQQQMISNNHIITFKNVEDNIKGNKSISIINTLNGKKYTMKKPMKCYDIS